MALGQTSSGCLALSASLLLVTVTAFIAIALQLYQRIEAQKRWVNAQVDLLLTASEESIPYFISSLQEFDEYSNMRLQALRRERQLTRTQRLRLELALLS